LGYDRIVGKEEKYIIGGYTEKYLDRQHCPMPCTEAQVLGINLTECKE
jgi:hypothetical protein